MEKANERRKLVFRESKNEGTIKKEINKARETIQGNAVFLLNNFMPVSILMQLLIP